MAIDSIQLTSEAIARYRAELVDYPDSLTALDVIEKRRGDLARATESLATQNGIEGVKDNSLQSWFAMVIQKCRVYICQPQYENLREEYLPALIPPLTDCIAGAFMCPPGVAGLLSTPIAIYIKEKGMDKFCQSSIDS
ncbi:MAG: hypothetical protein WCP16_17305 [Pseudanabaena sp. ELA645]|jgi:hypothetical protein